MPLDPTAYSSSLQPVRYSQPGDIVFKRRLPQSDVFEEVVLRPMVNGFLAFDANGQPATLTQEEMAEAIGAISSSAIGQPGGVAGYDETQGALAAKADALTPVFQSVDDDSTATIAANTFLLLSLASGNYEVTRALGTGTLGKQVRIFSKFAVGGSATLRVVDADVLLFEFTSGGGSGTGTLEFIHDGEAWVVAGPNVIFEQAVAPAPTPDSYWPLTADATDSVGDADFANPDALTFGADGVACDGVGYLRAAGFTMPANWTFTGWLKPAALPAVSVLLGKYADVLDSGEQNTFQLATVNNTLVAVFGDAVAEADVNVTGGALVVGDETFFAMSFDSASGLGSLTINNEMIGSAAAASLGENTLPLTLGSNGSGGAPFAGSIRHLRFFDSALSSDEIAALYNGGVAN